MVIALPDVEVAAVPEAKTPIFVISAGSEVCEKKRVRAFRREEVAVTGITRPEYTEHRFKSVSIFLFFLIERNCLAAIKIVAVLDIVKLDILACPAEAQTAKSFFLRRPEFYGVCQCNIAARTNDIIFIIPPLTAIGPNGKLDRKSVV